MMHPKQPRDGLSHPVLLVWLGYAVVIRVAVLFVGMDVP